MKLLTRFGSVLAWAAVFGIGTVAAAPAEPAYPFVGAWIRSDRTCSAASTRERIYTPHEVISSRGRCAIRKVAAGSNATFELFEKCERPSERSYRVSEIIHMMGSDSMVLTRKTARLKLSRSVRYTRCPVPTGVKPAR